jgi:hypothetical protein
MKTQDSAGRIGDGKAEKRIENSQTKTFKSKSFLMRVKCKALACAISPAIVLRGV